MVPAYQSSHSAQQHPYHSHPRRRSSSRASGASSRASLATPPLSPTSGEFYLRSAHGSILEFDSLQAPSEEQPAGPARQSGSADGRFMAVTKQEEMLLAALRMRRAHMRDSLTESEQQERSDSRLSVLSEQQQQLQKTSARSSSSTATIRESSAAPRSSSRAGSQPPAPSHSGGPTHSRRSATGSNPTTTPRPQRQQQQQQQHPDKRERILMYLDRPVDGVHALDAAEPSPDLSDFMDFDDGSDGVEDFPLPHSTSEPSKRSSSRASRGSPGWAAAAPMKLSPRTYLSPSRNSGGGGIASSGFPVPPRGRPDSTPISPKTLPRKMALMEDDVPARILETPLEGVEGDDGADSLREGAASGMPRPDSPLESEVQLPLPRKKAVRISAVGQLSMGVEAGWWDDRG